MKWGDFRDLFVGVAWKRLTPHEVDANVSNGHEFQGVGRLRAILGTEQTEALPTTYVLLRDDPAEIETIRSWAKWYDSRANQPHRGAEWRLYYPAEAGRIQSQMAAGDLMVIAVTRKRDLLIALAARGSGREQQLKTLFDIDEDSDTQLRIREFDGPVAVDFIAAEILEELGIALPDEPSGGNAAVIAALADELSVQYPSALPAGASISRLVRERIAAVDCAADPDRALFEWIEAEAAVFREWENRKIAARLREGFLLADGEVDIDAFRKFSMSLRQSRVSRAGGALQYHIREILERRHVRYVMEPIVDGGESPDFLFPSVEAYEDESYPAEGLRMLAAKFTAKDRWRQVLNEARRISPKHLLTLESGISRRQMFLMREAKLVLVMQEPVRAAYPTAQAAPIMSIAEFVGEVRGLPELDKNS